MSTDRRIKKTNQAIFNALQRLAEDTPIPSMTVTQVAKEANITRKTFYDHFPTVTDAYQAMLDAMMDQLARKTNADWEAMSQSELDTDPHSETELRLRLFLGNVRELFEAQLPQTRRRNRLITSDEISGYLVTPLTRHIERGLLGNPSRFNESADLVASFVLAGTLWAYRRGIAGEDEASFDVIQQRACTLLMGGLKSLM